MCRRHIKPGPGVKTAPRFKGGVPETSWDLRKRLHLHSLREPSSLSALSFAEMTIQSLQEILIRGRREGAPKERPLMPFVPEALKTATIFPCAPAGMKEQPRETSGDADPYLEASPFHTCARGRGSDLQAPALAGLLLRPCATTGSRAAASACIAE